MSNRTARVRNTSTTVQRSRTGCQTCRARKLKCDEQRPVCGQCHKSRRECVRTEGVTFRHQQNAALSSNETGNTLSSFYKETRKFTPEQLRNFVPIPETLHFVSVDDPFDDEQNGAGNTLERGTGSDTYQQVAAHTLEALSTAAAADHPPYASTTTYADYSSMYSQVSPQINYGSGRSEFNPGHHNNNISFLLNPSGTPSSMIDPNLEIPVHQLVDTSHAVKVSGSAAAENEELDAQSHESDMTDSKVAFVLKNFAEAQGQG